MIYTITICSEALSDSLNKDMSKQEWEKTDFTVCMPPVKGKNHQ